MKKQQIEFIEASIAEPMVVDDQQMMVEDLEEDPSSIGRENLQMDEPFIRGDDSEPQLIENLGPMASLQNLCTREEERPYEPMALRVTCALILDQRELFKQSLLYNLKNPPYLVTVEKFHIENDTAYLTFKEKEGITRVLDKPLLTLISVPLVMEAIPLREVEFTPEPSERPSILLVEQLPLDYPEDLTKGQLKYLFQRKGFNVTNCWIERGCGYFIFKEAEAVYSLIANPPDNSTLNGRPVKYTTDTPQATHPSDTTVNGPCVLVVDGLVHTFDKFEEALKFYLKNITGVSPLSCVVNGQQAIVKFTDDNVARQLVRSPPTAPLLGNTLMFSLRPDTPIVPRRSPPEYQETPPPIPHQSLPVYQKTSPPIVPRDSPSEYRNVLSHSISDESYHYRNRLDYEDAGDRDPVSSSLPVSPPKPRPRRPRSRSLIVGQVPLHYSNEVVKAQLESLTKVDCKGVKLKKQTALVEMDQPINVDKLRTDLLKRGHSLTIDTIDPSTSLLITFKEPMDPMVVKYSCERYCSDELKVKGKSSQEFIVTFSTQEDLKEFENSNHRNRISNKPVTITPYHPLIASFDEDDEATTEILNDLSYSSDDETPPPIPPQNFDKPVRQRREHVYQYVAHRVILTEAEEKFMMQKLSEMNRELIAFHGEASIVGDALMVRPLELAKELMDWEQKVSDIVEKHRKELVTNSIAYTDANKPAIMEYLHRHQSKHKDFHFIMTDQKFEISGGAVSVIEATEHIKSKMADNNNASDDAETSLQIRKEPYLIDYLIKFGKEELESIQPPLTYSRNYDDSGVLTLEGLQESLDKAETLINNKLARVSVESVLLTSQAYRLLDSATGKQRLTENLGHLLDSVHYTFEKISNEDQFTHSVYVVSDSNPAKLALAKRKIEVLCKEEKIFLPPEKAELTKGSRWTQLLEERSNLFVKVRTQPDMVVITGDETDIKKMVDSIHKFMETLNEATEEMSVETCVWQVIQMHLKIDLERLVEEANRNKVQVTLPIVDEDKPNVSVRLYGNVRYINNVKTELNQMEAEVHSRGFSIPPKPGMHRLLEKGMMKGKCDELTLSNKVFIRFSIESDRSSSNSSPYEPPTATTDRVITSTSSVSGVRVNIFTGNYAEQKCDAFVTFIPDDPQFIEPVFISLSNFGGPDVQNDFETTLGKQKLVPGSLYSTRRTGNLQCIEIIHIVLPRFSLLVGRNTLPQTTLQRTLQQVFDNTSPKYNTVVLCPPTLPPLNYPADLYASSLSTAVNNIKTGPYGTDLSLQVFVDDTYEVNDFEMSLKKEGFKIHDRKRLDKAPVFRPRKVVQPGTPESLQKVVKITTGDMFDIQADVYINSTGPEMDFNSGNLAGTFKTKCGQPLMDEVDDFLTYEGKLKYGKVAVTSANNLKASAIYHIALKPTDHPGYERSFRETVQNIFLTAKDYGHKSIAIPCLGVAGLGYKPQLSAMVLFESVISFHYKHPTAITEFIFVVHRDVDKEAFYKEYDLKIQQFTKSSVTRHPVPSATKVSLDTFNVEIVNGNIADERTEVIVNSTSEDMLEKTNQISKAIFAAAGDDMRATCASLVDCDVLLKDGQVVPTNASGELRCDKVYHAHIPGKTNRDLPPSRSEADLFKKVIRNCLELAEDCRQESVAFPAFCLGIGNYTVEQSGRLMFEAFDEFGKMSPKYLSKVRIVVYDKQKYEEFAAYHKQAITGGVSSSLSTASTSSIASTSPLLKKSQPSLSNGVSLSQKISCPKTGVRFNVYGITNKAIDDTELALKDFVSEAIFKDMVDLGGAIRLFSQDDLDKLMEVAFQNGVEFEVEHDFERIVIMGEETAVDKICSKIQQKKNDLQGLCQELQIYHWIAEDPKYGNKAYEQDIMAQIEVAYKRNLPSVEVIVEQTPVVINFGSMEEQDTGGTFQRKVARVKKTLEPELPREWCPQPCDSQGLTKVVHFETLTEFSPEYAQATQGFLNTMGNIDCTIVSVKRVQNPGEYSRYCSLKGSWESALGPGVVKEREVFHGTREESLLSICSQGFNRIFAADNNAAHFGKGVYFALNAWYSAQDKYSSKARGSNHKHMLVCSLLVGNYTRGNKSMKVAPPLPQNSQVIYDTLVDKVDSPTIFVAMKDSQAYPKYWITFVKNN